jgi:CBS domain-containing protein
MKGLRASGLPGDRQAPRVSRQRSRRVRDGERAAAPLRIRDVSSSSFTAGGEASRRPLAWKIAREHRQCQRRDETRRSNLRVVCRHPTEALSPQLSPDTPLTPPVSHEPLRGPPRTRRTRMIDAARLRDTALTLHRTRSFHPSLIGGHIMLGKICTRPVVTASAQMTVDQAAQTMRSKNVGALVVVNAGRPIGMITDRDVTVEVVAKGMDPDTVRVGDVMRKKPVTICEDLGILDAAQGLRQDRRTPAPGGHQEGNPGWRHRGGRPDHAPRHRDGADGGRSFGRVATSLIGRRRAAGEHASLRRAHEMAVMRSSRETMPTTRSSWPITGRLTTGKPLYLSE